MAKGAWKKLVWEQAWEIRDCYWSSTVPLCKGNDLLRGTIKGIGYMTYDMVAA